MAYKAPRVMPWKGSKTYACPSCGKVRSKTRMTKEQWKAYHRPTCSAVLARKARIDAFMKISMLDYDDRVAYMETLTSDVRRYITKMEFNRARRSGTARVKPPPKY